jgi:hypothetical protein
MISFQNTVYNRLYSNSPQNLKNQEGRTKLLIGSSLVGLGYYGWAIPIMLDIQDFKGVLGMYMLTAGTSIFLPFQLTKDQDITKAQSTFFVYGQTRGIANGLILSMIADIEEESGFLGLGMLFSIAEGIGGYHWAKKAEFTNGRAQIIGGLSDFGYGIGAGIAATFGDPHTKNAEQKFFASTLMGSVLSTAGAYYLSKNQNYSVGDAIYARSSAILGAHFGLATAVLFEPSNEEVYFGLTTFGAIGGIAASHFLTKDIDLTQKQSIMICLAQLSGGLIGLGTSYLLTFNDDNLPKTLATTSALGAFAGFAFFSNKYDIIKSNKSEETAFNLSLNPMGILTAYDSKKFNGNHLYMPILTIGKTF